MKLFKNRFIIAAVCLVVAVAIAFVALPSFYKSKQATAMVCRTVSDIPRGTLIDDSHIAITEVGAYNLPADAITDPALLIGQYALTDIPKDDLLLPNKVGVFLFSETLDTLISNGQRLVSVTLPSTAAGVAGHLETGDTVSVVCFLDAREQYVVDPATGIEFRENIPAETIVYPELRSIKVYNIENAKTENMEELKNAEDTAVDVIPKTVTLIVTDEQALKLVEAEYTGKIHLVFERRDV